MFCGLFPKKVSGSRSSIVLALQTPPTKATGIGVNDAMLQLTHWAWCASTFNTQTTIFLYGIGQYRVIINQLNLFGIFHHKRKLLSPLTRKQSMLSCVVSTGVVEAGCTADPVPLVKLSTSHSKLVLVADRTQTIAQHTDTKLWPQHGE